jgi:hypothetical protein
VSDHNRLWVGTQISVCDKRDPSQDGGAKMVAKEDKQNVAASMR